MDNEATEQLGISDQTLHQFESAVAVKEFDTALSLIPSANYLNISNQADDRRYKAYLSYLTDTHP